MAKARNRRLYSTILAAGAFFTFINQAVLAEEAGAKLIASGISYPEGPLLKDGKLYFVEYGASNVDKWDGQNLSLVWHEDGCGANSVIDTVEGNFLVACADASKVVEIDSKGKVLRNITADKNGVTLNAPNDFARDKAGGIYVTTSGKFDWSAPIEGKVFYIAPDGNVTMVADTLHFANGLSLVDEGKTLLVGEYMGGKIVEFPVGVDGQLEHQRKLLKSIADIAPVAAGTAGYPGPDGIKIDSKGNLYIAQYATGRILVTDRNGNLLRILKVPAGNYTTNLALSADENSVYVTTTYDDANAPFPGAIYQIPNK